MWLTSFEIVKALKLGILQIYRHCCHNHGAKLLSNIDKYAILIDKFNLSETVIALESNLKVDYGHYFIFDSHILSIMCVFF